MDFVLARKNPVERMMSSISSGFADAYARASGYLANSCWGHHVDPLVGRLRRQHVATSSSSGFVKSSSQCASG